MKTITFLPFQRSLAVLALTSVVLCGEYDHHQIGYSYSKFSGPVSGPDHKIDVHDKHGHPSYDYVAHPSYNFEYGVEDPKSHVSQKRQEHRDGDDVHGEYTVAQPDGKIRTVKYTADKHGGFNAEVTIDGVPLHHEALAEQQAHLDEQAAHAASQAAAASHGGHGSHYDNSHHESSVLHEEPAHHGGEETSGYGGGYETAEAEGSVESGHEYY